MKKLGLTALLALLLMAPFATPAEARIVIAVGGSHHHYHHHYRHHYHHHYYRHR